MPQNPPIPTSLRCVCSSLTLSPLLTKPQSDYLLSSIAAPYDGDEVLLNAGTLTPDSTATFLGVLIFLRKAVSLTCKATSTTCVLNGDRNNVQIMQAYFIALEETTLTRIKVRIIGRKECFELTKTTSTQQALDSSTHTP